MILWNLRSLLADEKKLANLLQVFEDNDIQVACLCETWFDRQNGPFTATIKAAGFEIKHVHEKKSGVVELQYCTRIQWTSNQVRRVPVNILLLNTHTAL